MDGNSSNFLVETALLTHGLNLVSNEELLIKFEHFNFFLTWIDQGKIIISNIENFLQFRKRSNNVIRIDGSMVKYACKNSLSGALTASGTMEVARQMGINLAVTAGMGGIGNIPDEKFCYDLTALKEMPVTLIATSPKDMLDFEATINWLMSNGVVVSGIEQDYTDGFIFLGKKIPITQKYQENKPKGKHLILNSIPINKRIENINILKKAILAGKNAFKKGNYFYPAVNFELDRLSNGLSGNLQLESLISNIEIANKIIK